MTRSPLVRRRHVTEGRADENNNSQQGVKVEFKLQLKLEFKLKLKIIKCFQNRVKTVKTGKENNLKAAARSIHISAETFPPPVTRPVTVMTGAAAQAAQRGFLQTVAAHLAACEVPHRYGIQPAENYRRGPAADVSRGLLFTSTVRVGSPRFVTHSCLLSPLPFWIEERGKKRGQKYVYM